MEGGGHVLQGGVCGRGAYVAEGIHGRGWEACVVGDGGAVARQTATTADTTHPTGMHSC